MTATEKLQQWFLEKVPEAPDQYPPVDHQPVSTVSVSALGGRSVEVNEMDFERLVMQAGISFVADMTHTDMGRLLTAAKDHGPRELLDALLSARTPTTPVYRVRKNGRPWRPGGLNQNMMPTGIEP